MLKNSFGNLDKENCSYSRSTFEDTGIVLKKIGTLDRKKTLYNDKIYICSKINALINKVIDWKKYETETHIMRKLLKNGTQFQQKSGFTVWKVHIISFFLIL